MFTADKRGRIDLTRDAPESGTYTGVDAMGLIWSGVPSPSSGAWDVRMLPILSLPSPLTFGLELLIDGRSVDHALLTQRFLPVHARRLDVRESGLVGTLFMPTRITRPPVVITLGGSEGGLDSAEAVAMLLAEHGFAALALAYFRAEGLPKELVEIPIEYFERAIEWLKHRDDLAADRLGLVGGSRGGELALLLASKTPEVRAVVAYSSANVVSYGVPRVPHPELLPRVAAWTYHGAPIPFYIGKFPAPEDAPQMIPVELIRGPILVIAGGHDRLVPQTAAMGAAIMRRLALHHHPYRDALLTYPEAGHSIVFPYLVVAPRLLLGGSPAANAQADRDSWRRVLRFLARSLAVH
jgi:dienelactone hydrolase